MRRTPGSRAMIKLVLISLLIFLWVILLSPRAYAQEGQPFIEGSAGIGIGPDDPDSYFGTTFSGGMGLGYKVDDEELRLDISYYKWKDSIALRNVSVFFGGRHYFLATSSVIPFLEFGMSLDFFDAELEVSGTSISDSEIKIGAVPGYGLKYMISPRLGLSIDLRRHIIVKGVGQFTEGKTSFSSAAAAISYYF